MFKKFLRGFDTPIEVAGWLMFAGGFGFLAFERLTSWEALPIMVMGLVTAGGMRHFRGLRVGPKGIEIGDSGLLEDYDEDEEDHVTPDYSDEDQ